MTPSEALNYRGLQLAFSFYCDDHQASTILLTEKTYSFLLELWSSGTQPRDRLPDATILPRFSRDYSFENAEVSGIVNRLIPFGLLEQEMGGHGEWNCFFAFPLYIYDPIYPTSFPNV